MPRYERNILTDRIGKEGQNKLKNAKVLVCGAGGLGSGVIANLASLGVGHIGIVDDDKVELSNLNRQYIHKMTSLGSSKVHSAVEWVKSYNPAIEVIPYNMRLDANNASALFSNHDVIVDCFDNFSSKFTLSDFAIKTNKILVHGGVEEFCGQVCVISKNHACLACFMPELYEARDYALPKKGILSPVVSTIAALESMEVLKIITNTGVVLFDTLLAYNGLDDSFRKIHIAKNPVCPCCAK